MRSILFALVFVPLLANALPNILIVLMDDVGWGDVGYNAVPSRQYQPGAGGTDWKPNPPQTPNIDEMAKSPNSLVFHQFYAGSAVCSPSRSSLLSGRTPDRECIFDANGCGQEPAYGCDVPLPFPPTIFTIAQAAKARNMSTIGLGKWHLGNFFPKGNLRPVPQSTVVGHKEHSYAYNKWPVSNPGMHGFDEWSSTEASASSSMCNCGCKEEWIQEGQGCVIGGGKWQHSALPCTNYWGWASSNKTSSEGRELPKFSTNYEPTFGPYPPSSSCLYPTSATLDCVANMTTKISGDDNIYLMDQFEAFLQTQQVRSKQKQTQPDKSAQESNSVEAFFAILWLHTNHKPHPAMPEYYYAYNDTYGNPAGDYLGTITQMDAQIGRLRKMLQTYGVANDTLLWFTSDNGPTGQEPDIRSTTNGLRQCKASVFEGGIRAPGIIEWPGQITQNRETWVPAYVPDMLPTILDILNVTHPHPTWAMDGESILPLITQSSTTLSPSAATASPLKPVKEWARTKPLGFRYHEQLAWIDPTGYWKLVINASRGHCEWEHGPNTSSMAPDSDQKLWSELFHDIDDTIWGRDSATAALSSLGYTHEEFMHKITSQTVDEHRGPFLFHLKTDPTESYPMNEKHPDRYAKMTAEAEAWVASILVSQREESQCMPPDDNTQLTASSSLPVHHKSISPIPNVVDVGAFSHFPISPVIRAPPPLSSSVQESDDTPHTPVSPLSSPGPIIPETKAAQRAKDNSINRYGTDEENKGLLNDLRARSKDLFSHLNYADIVDAHD